MNIIIAFLLKNRYRFISVIFIVIIMVIFKYSPFEHEEVIIMSAESDIILVGTGYHENPVRGGKIEFIPRGKRVDVIKAGEKAFVRDCNPIKTDIEILVERNGRLLSESDGRFHLERRRATRDDRNAGNATRSCLGLLGGK